MSFEIKPIDLTLYGCPMHYIKAREAIKTVELEKSITIEVNNGDAVDEVLNSLRQDGQLCELQTKGKLSSLIKITRKV
ncbi:MAG: hypothetical protein P1P93_00730 [Gammaproteobacteria bacterium]|nr:hypothetical protein [Gammaproteobacteria bacterium]MDT8370879.1 hypothetical protein [Gammaproteobacteria bacterium]